MEVEIRPVKDRGDLRRFIRLPEEIHTGHTTWVPPLYMHERPYFDPRKNSSSAFCDSILLLAFRAEKVVGRIMGIVNHRYNALRQETTARFSCLETNGADETAKMLLSRVEDWARFLGMTKIVGPYGFSDQDPEGFLVEGFEHRATIGTYCNFDWMPILVEEAGYSKEIDYVTFRIDVPKDEKEVRDRMVVYERARDLISARSGIELVRLETRKDARRWARPVFRLMNESFTKSRIYGYCPLNESEMDDLARKYLPLLDPRFVAVARKGEEPVGFIIGLPDMSEGFRKARGRVLPFGFVHVLSSRSRSRQLDLLLGAVKEEYRRAGVLGILAVKLGLSAHKAGMEWVDTHHVMETNRKMIREYERLGGRIYKRFRVYQKQLVP
ncbi:MAG: hypothetical protein LLG06_17380 [Desulfobacteraceae bacterium]|nr:hypothetical protein [Desulfobacteraceae bacterium]